MKKLFQSLVPRSVLGVILFLFFSICAYFACFFFELTHPDYIFTLAVAQGIWLGIWCQDLHQFAGSHKVPHFASRIMRFYLMVLVATGLSIASMALANHDLFSIVGLYMAIVVIVSIFTLLTQNWLVVFLPVYGIMFGMSRISDAGREGIANLFSSSYLYPVSVLALSAGLAILYSLLNKPVNTEQRSLRQQYGKEIKTGRWHSGGIYGVNWSTHLKAASGGVLLTLAIFYFFEPPSNMFFIFWLFWIMLQPAQNVGRSIGIAPRAWLSGAIHSRSHLSSALLLRFLGIAGIYTLAGLALSPLSNLLNINLPDNFESVFIAAFAASALGLGLISSYSSNLEEKILSFQRHVLLLGICFLLFVLSNYSVEFIWGYTGLVACAAPYFLYRGHQRITKLEFITF